MNGSSTNEGSWPAGDMYTYVNEDIYESLPSELSSVIISTSVVTGYGASDSSNFTSSDNLYLLSPKEVWNLTTDSDTAASSTRQLDYYNNHGVSTSSYSGAIKKLNGEEGWWWLRTPSNYNDQAFFAVSSNGDYYDEYPTYDYGVSPAFRIG